MGFEKLDIQPTYFSNGDDGKAIMKDFYIPALSQAKYYYRSVGYFSSGIFEYAMQGVIEFARKGGKMCLVVGDSLNDEEYDAVKRGHQNKVQEKIMSSIEMVFENSSQNNLNLQVLTHLVSSDQLEIKFAFRRNGIYHDKIGLLVDENGQEILFHGSANETIKGLVSEFNDESIDVFSSFKGEVYRDYALAKRDIVKGLCEGRPYGTTLVVDMPSEAYQKIVSYKNDDFDLKALGGSYSQEDIYDEINKEALLKADEDNLNGLKPFVPNFLFGSPYRLKKHQEDALNEWQKNDYKGIFALATGAGKTITAIHTAVRISESKKLALIISVPYQVLADQWCDVLELFNIFPIRCYESSQKWLTELESTVGDFNLPIGQDFFAAVVVNRTLKTDKFQSIISNIKQSEMMFVGDECHRHSNQSWKAYLPDASFRIGLSATPWSVKDEESSLNLTSYYGQVVSVYTIDDALNQGVLEKYEYVLHEVYLSSEEEQVYLDLSAQIASLIHATKNNASFNRDALDSKIRARARLLGSVQDKFETLDNILSTVKKSQHTLFYCGDGNTDDSDIDGLASSTRDVERVSRILTKNGWYSSRFTARESRQDRKIILENFKTEVIDAVIAIRVLDEGFDLPSCREAFLLASSRNERQFIQRRGRVLRKHQDKTKAIIHDFLVLPSNVDTLSLKNLVRDELCRAFEFARVALNKDALREKLVNLAQDKGIDVEEVEFFYQTTFEVKL